MEQQQEHLVSSRWQQKINNTLKKLQQNYPLTTTTTDKTSIVFMSHLYNKTLRQWSISRIMTKAVRTD